MTKIFFDTEFTGLHQGTNLISIGLIADLGPALGTKSFYAELTDYDRGQVDQWIQENVINNLKNSKMPHNSYQLSKEGNINCRCNMEHLKMWLTAWLSYDSIQMWGDVDVIAYDWVLFCQIFGGAQSIPKNIFYIPGDLSTLFIESSLEDSDINREIYAELQDSPGKLKHNSLWDAFVTMQCYLKRKRLARGYLFNRF